MRGIDYEPPDPLVRERLQRVWSDSDFPDGIAGEGDRDHQPTDPLGPPARDALAALNPGRRAVIALALVGVLVAVVVAYLAWRAQPHTEVIAPGAAVSGAAVSGAGAPGVGAPAAASPVAGVPTPAASGGADLVVAVTGRVRHPGLVHLPAGARVADAIAAAGGVLPGTDLEFVNLAARVTDGELIVVGATPPPGTVIGGPGGGGAGTPGIVNLNTATVADLDTLPGIGPALAQHIIDYRTAHGGFHSVGELRNVSGIGDAKFAEIKDLVTV